MSYRSRGLDYQGVRARRARTTRDSKWLGYKLVPGYLAAAIEGEQLFPLDAIFQFEHLNNRGCCGFYSKLALRETRTREKERKSTKRKEKRNGEGGEDLSAIDSKSQRLRNRYSSWFKLPFAIVILPWQLLGGKNERFIGIDHLDVFMQLQRGRLQQGRYK